MGMTQSGNGTGSAGCAGLYPPLDLRILKWIVSAVFLSLSNACSSPTPTASVPATNQLLAGVDLHSAGKLNFTGHVSRRRGPLTVPVAFGGVELVQSDRVIATAKTDHAGYFHLVGIIRNGLVDIRLAEDPSVRVTLDAKWQSVHVDGLELLAPLPPSSL